MTACTPIGLAVLLWASVQSGQAQLSPYVWQQASVSPPAPAPDDYDFIAPRLAYDSFRSETVMAPRQPARVTWLWNGAAWRSIAESVPTNVYPAAMVYDTDRHVMVAFCWTGLSTNRGLTYEWNGSSWSEAATTNSPPSVFECVMTYDQKRHRTVLFGGSGRPDLDGDLDNTYEYDGTQWYLAATNGPSSRHDAVAVYDAKRGVTVLFGGISYDNTIGILGDTWTWDGANWTEVAVTGPPGRRSASMAYDSFRERVLLYGGAVSQQVQQIGDELWEWDGTHWSLSVSNGPTDLSNSSPGRFVAGLAYDSARQEAVLNGGVANFTDGTWTQFADTWLLNLRYIWVDYAWHGAQTGDFATPFSTLSNAVTAAFPVSFINFKTNSGTEHLTVVKPVTLQAPLGPVTIH